MMSRYLTNENLRLSSILMGFIQVGPFHLVTPLFLTCTYIPRHLDCVGCVRWSSLGDMLASASNDETVKLLDFKTGKVQYTGTTFDGSNLLY